MIKNKNMHPRQLEIAQALSSVDLTKAIIISIDGFYYRTISYRRSTESLSTVGAEKTGGRFNFRPVDANSMPCLYCGEKDVAATTEKFYGLKRDNKPLPPHTVVSIAVKLNHVVDLSDRNQCNLAGIDWDLLNEPWEYYQDRLKIAAYSQEIGRLVFESPQLEAIKFTSTKLAGNYNLAIFTNKLKLDSSIQLYDPDGDLS